MIVLGYQQSHSLSEFSISSTERPEPAIGPKDLLVRVKAVSINPVDYKIRQTRSSKNGELVVLGWDASGTIEKIGSSVQGFLPGDEVFYAGDLLRDGSYSELQSVDYRIVAKKPKSLTFEDAASLPLTSLTAWEALFEKNIKYTPATKVLIIGGAGGVGSLATQLLKLKTPAQVITTASREISSEWSKKMGADIVVDHSKNLGEELKNNHIDSVDIIFSTNHSEKYFEQIPQLLRPFGHFILIDDPKIFDIVPFKRKSLSVHWELMFTKTLTQHLLESQGRILSEIASLVDSGDLKPTMAQQFRGLTSENIKKAHEIVEKGATIGKVIISTGF